MKDKLVKKSQKLDPYCFITNLHLEKEYYDFCHNNLKVNNVKSVKRKVYLFVRTQPSWVQSLYKTNRDFYFVPGHDPFHICKKVWL